jgi:hypothetical protein
MTHGDLRFSVDYDVNIPSVVMTWKGYATSAVFRATNEQVLQTISERRASKLLGDITEFVLIGADDQDWLNTVWLPSAMEAGLRMVALVTPNFYFNRVAVENVVKKLDPTQLQVAYFATRDEAAAWLKSA